MHSEGITHGDIRAENIMLDKDDKIKIVDVQLFRKSDHTTKINPDVDLPYYSSPEDLKTKHQSQSKASDIWGIGIILYNLLSSKQPFEGEE